MERERGARTKDKGQRGGGGPGDNAGEKEGQQQTPLRRGIEKVDQQ